MRMKFRQSPRYRIRTSENCVHVYNHENSFPPNYSVSGLFSVDDKILYAPLDIDTYPALSSSCELHENQRAGILGIGDHGRTEGNFREIYEN